MEPDPVEALAPNPSRRRYKLTLAYDGTAFHGWQKQEPPDKDPLRTVAGEVSSALGRLLGQPISLVGASRTDAGVHARGQVAHFDASVRIPLHRLAHAINSRLGDDVEVVAVEPAAPDFDAISDAVAKQYRYRVFNTPQRPLQKRYFVWHCWTPLKVEPMRDAAARLVGTHDVAGFAAAGHGRTSTVRTIFDCRIETERPELRVVVEGDGFLYNMVRIIAGTLVEVGRGRFEPSIIDRVFKTGDRSLGGPTLPAHGLCLEWVKYGEEATKRRSDEATEGSGGCF